MKKFWIASWILTLLAIFIVTIVNNSPYILMGGSSSVAPIMQDMFQAYKHDNSVHSKIKGDFNYVTSASSAAPSRVKDGIFGIGWMSEPYNATTLPSNVVMYHMMDDKITILYNLPASDFNGNTPVPLNFTPDIMINLYVKNETWDQAFKGQDSSQYNGKYPFKPGLTIASHPFTRPNGSGTRTVFDQKCLNGTTFYQASIVDSSSAMMNLDVGAIGYTSYSDIKQANHMGSQIGLWKKIDPSSDGYKLTRPFNGLINTNYKYINDIIKYLKWINNEDSILKKLFDKYGSTLYKPSDISHQNSDFYSWWQSVNHTKTIKKSLKET